MRRWISKTENGKLHLIKADDGCMIALASVGAKCDADTTRLVGGELLRFDHFLRQVEIGDSACYTNRMNNQRARYVWDYDLTQEQFDAMLAGEYVDGHLNRDWAAVRLIEWAPYREMIQRLGYKALVENWPRWRQHVRSHSTCRGIDFLVRWLPTHHPELLT